LSGSSAVYLYIDIYGITTPGGLSASRITDPTPITLSVVKEIETIGNYIV